MFVEWVIAKTERLFAVELQHLELVDIPLEMVVYVHGTHAQWCTCIEQVARFEGEEAADVGYQCIDGENHVGRAPLLYGFPVDVEVEGQCLQIAEALFGNPFADGC